MSDTFDHEADAWDSYLGECELGVIDTFGHDVLDDTPYHHPVRGVHRKYKPNKRHSASDAFKGFEED